MIADVLEAVKTGRSEQAARATRENVARLCERFPIYAYTA